MTGLDYGYSHGKGEAQDLAPQKGHCYAIMTTNLRTNDVLSENSYICKYFSYAA